MVSLLCLRNCLGCTWAMCRRFISMRDGVGSSYMEYDRAWRVED